MVRVLQIVGSLGYAGLEAVIMNYYRNINTDKVQFDFVTCSRVKQRYDDEIEARGGRVYRLPLRVQHFFGYVKELSEILKENRYDIVHINQNSASMTLEAFIAKLYGVKCVIGHSHSTSCNALWQHYLLRPFVNWFTDYRFACSPKAGEWVFGKKKDIKLINNAVDVKRYAFVPEIREKYRKAFGFDHDLVIGFVGRLGKEKNLFRTLDIFCLLKKTRSDAKLILVGVGSETSELKKYAEHKGISESVKFLGVREDVPEILAMLDVFLMTSLYEGMPVVSAEAQASGLRCVFSKNVPSPDLIGNVDFLSLEDSDEKWVAALLKKTSVNREAAAQKIINQGYDISSAAAELQKFYLNLR